jgi:hypothetical protein
MTPHGCAVSFFHSLVPAHITLSSVHCCHCVRLTALKLHRMRPSLHHFMYFIYTKTVCNLSETDFMIFEVIIFIFLVFHKLFELNRQFTLKMGSNIKMVLSVAIIDEYQDFT